MDCQISSVINGMNGWSSFSASRMTYTSTFCAARAVSPPAAILGFVSSMYQSQ